MALLFIPLRQLTNARAVVQPVVVRVMPESALQLAITATSGPFEFVVKHLGNVIWKGEANTTTVIQMLQLPFPAEGLELGLEGDFKNATVPAAVKLSVTPKNGATLEQVVWTSGPVDEVLTFQP